MNWRFLVKEALARAVAEPMLAAGCAPSWTPTRRALAWALKDRDLRFPDDHPLKPLESIAVWDNTFALSRSSLLWLWARLQIREPRFILELGSGRTTFALATFAWECEKKQLPVPRIVTVEAEPEWMAQTREKLREHGLERHIQFVAAEAIETPDEHGYDFSATDLEERLEGGPVDFLLIDGPSGGQGRAGTLRRLYHFLSEDAEIFLDDCERPNEKRTLKRWTEEFAGQLENRGIVPTVGGLGWLSRR